MLISSKNPLQKHLKCLTKFRGHCVSSKLTNKINHHSPFPGDYFCTSPSGTVCVLKACHKGCYTGLPVLPSPIYTDSYWGSRLTTVHIDKSLLWNNSISYYSTTIDGPTSVRWSQVLVFSWICSAQHPHCVTYTKGDKPLFHHLQTCIKVAEVTISYGVLIEKQSF